MLFLNPNLSLQLIELVSVVERSRPRSTSGPYETTCDAEGAHICEPVTWNVTSASKFESEPQWFRPLKD